tara:strand:+ start:269 stop:427 length:159 start_codon:yes stop_codon:yes gene_type:complete
MTPIVSAVKCVDKTADVSRKNALETTAKLNWVNFAGDQINPVGASLLIESMP